MVAWDWGWKGTNVNLSQDFFEGGGDGSGGDRNVLKLKCGESFTIL